MDMRVHTSVHCQKSLHEYERTLSESDRVNFLRIYFGDFLIRSVQSMFTNILIYVGCYLAIMFMQWADIVIVCVFSNRQVSGRSLTAFYFGTILHYCD